MDPETIRQKAILGYRTYKNGIDPVLYAYSAICALNYAALMVNNLVFFRGRIGQEPNQAYQNNIEEQK